MPPKIEKTEDLKPLNESIKESIDPVNFERKTEEVNDVVEESTESDFKNKGNTKSSLAKWKKVTGCGICLIILGIFMAAGVTAIVHSQILSNINNQVILSKDNEDMWAHYPGSTETVITRNYTFFKFLNEEDYLLHGKKPKLAEIEGYKIQEFEDFLNITYSDDGNSVKMKDWLHFTDYEGTRNLEEKIKILNVPALGFWSILKNSRPQIIFIEGYSLVFESTALTIMDIVRGEGLHSQFLLTQEIAISEIFEPAGVPPESWDFLWNDFNYGMREKNNFQHWIQAFRTSFIDENEGFSSEALNLKDYFGLTDFQLFEILNDIGEFTSALEGIVFENFYCQGIEVCDGRELTIRQIADSYITLKTPPTNGIEAKDSICEKNNTCKNTFAEIGAYYKREYVRHFPIEDPDLAFDYDTVRGWLDYNPSRIPGEYNKAENALFHIGNLDALFQNGTKHDEVKHNFTQETPYLINIMNRFKLASPAHTRVFWEWVKYLVESFVRKDTGNNEIVGIANIFSPTMYDNFIFLKDNLQIDLLTKMIKNKLDGQMCFNFLAVSLQTQNEDLVNNICNFYNNSLSEGEFIRDGIMACRYKFKENWIELTTLGATYLNLQSFCDISFEGGFGELYHQMKIELNDFYKCHYTPYEYCSDFELAAIQWANSTVTLAQPPSVGNSLGKSTTFADWNPKAKPFEYGHFVSKFSDRVFPIITIEEAVKELNYDGHFSILVNINKFKDHETSSEWKDYIRYVVVFMGLNGLARERTAREFMLGYNDEYLLERKNNYPPFGGDPSTPVWTAFNDLNQTEEEVTLEVEWHTGKDDTSKVGQYISSNGLSYLATNYTKFNGNETYWVLESPWAEKDYFYGTNGKTFKPDQYGSRNISIYVPNIQRYGSGLLNTSENYERFGYPLEIAELDPQMYQSEYDNPDNKKYYQTFEGIFNETSVVGFPFYMTKHMFLNSSDNWTTFVDIYSESGETQIPTPTTLQDSRIIYEPYSGVAFQSTLYLQANYLHQPDLLFTYNQTCLIPAFTVNRSGNLTEESANKLLGPLKTALSAKTAIMIVGIVVACLGGVITGFGVLKILRSEKGLEEKKENKSVLTGSDISENTKNDDNPLNNPLMKEIECDEN